MTIKRLCDLCLREVKKNYVEDTLYGRVGFDDRIIQLEIRVGMGMWGQGEMCLDCLSKCVWKVINNESKGRNNSYY